MNIRKPADYSQMLSALDQIMAVDLPQMELYTEIGRLVCARPEKGAAVMAAEYLSTRYPDATGFSLRNLDPSAGDGEWLDAKCGHPGSRADSF